MGIAYYGGMTMNDGGPAFPRPLGSIGDAKLFVERVSDSQDGISARDYFAAAALQGIIAGAVPLGELNDGIKNVIEAQADELGMNPPDGEVEFIEWVGQKMKRLEKKPETATEYGKRIFWRRFDHLTELRKLDAPDVIMARVVWTLWQIAPLAFGKRCYEAMADSMQAKLKNDCGFCADCEQPAIEGMWYCQSCLDKIRELEPDDEDA